MRGGRRGELLITGIMSASIPPPTRITTDPPLAAVVKLSWKTPGQPFRCNCWLVGYHHHVISGGEHVVGTCCWNALISEVDHKPPPVVSIDNSYELQISPHL